MGGASRSTGGGSGMCSSWPGRMNGDPVTNSADDTAESSLGIKRSPNSTQGIDESAMPGLHHVHIRHPKCAGAHTVKRPILKSSLLRQIAPLEYINTL
jgi:hypothetical protein